MKIKKKYKLWPQLCNYREVMIEMYQVEGQLWADMRA